MGKLLGPSHPDRTILDARRVYVIPVTRFLTEQSLQRRPDR